MSTLYSQPIVLDLPNDQPPDIASGDLAPGNSIRCGNRSDLPKKERVWLAALQVARAIKSQS